MYYEFGKIIRQIKQFMLSYKTKICMYITFFILNTRDIPHECIMATRNLHSSHFPVHHTSISSCAGTVGTRQLITWWIMNSREVLLSGWVREPPCGRQRVRDKILGNECIKEIVFIVRSQPRHVPTPPQLSTFLNQLFPLSSWPESLDAPLTPLVTMKGGSGVMVDN